MLLNYGSIFYNFLLLFGRFRVLFRGLLGFNQSQFRSLIGYSSIAHRGWLVCSCVAGFKIVLVYFLVYRYLNLVLFILFDLLNKKDIISGSYGNERLGVINLLLLSLAGIPPFSVFFIKVIVLSYIIFYPVFVFILVAGGILSVYYYLTFIIPRMVGMWRSLGRSFN